MPPFIRDLMTTFDVAYHSKTGMRYPFVGGKEAKILQGLLKLYTVDQVSSFIAAFFESEDDFIVGSGYSFGAFKGCLPKVIASLQRKPQPVAGCPHTPLCFNENACAHKVKYPHGFPLKAIGPRL